MARDRTVYRCGDCGSEEPRWAGRCGACGAWNTLEARVVRAAPPVALSSVAAGAGGGDEAAALALTDVEAGTERCAPTGIAELDRVLGGGLVPGSVTLLGGEPGVGKSTLVLQVLAGRAVAGADVLYLSGEESVVQLRMRAERLGVLHPRIGVAAESSLPEVRGLVEATAPALCVVDSVQTLQDPSTSGSPGSMNQVRDCVAELVSFAKAGGTTVILVGHVTKGGDLAGPRALEHAVDTVLHLEGDRHHELRVLRAVKHRFGSTQEIGLLRMGSAGLESVADPSALFLGDRHPGIPGSVVTATVDGHRPVLVEIQALTAPGLPAQTRRSAQGLDSARLGQLLAVLQRRVGLSVANLDVYAKVVGGTRVVEPGADLALCMAVASSARSRPVPESLVAIGEVGLGGELRSVPRVEVRLAEAARHGFSTALVPPNGPDRAEGIEVLRVPTLETALTLFDLL